MRISTQAKALLALSLISTSVFAESCYGPKTPEVGETVYVSASTAQGTIFTSASIIKLRSNKNYVIRTDEELSTGNKYLTNVNKNSLYPTRGCGYTTSNRNFNIKISENVYILETEVITPGDFYNTAVTKNTAKKVNIVAFNPNYTHSIYKSIDSETIDSETEKNANIPSLRNNTLLYSQNYCSKKSDDGQEICSRDIAISLGFGVDVEVLGVNSNDHALVEFRDGTVKDVSIKQLLKIQGTEQEINTIEP
jgi:hypothetical protein